MATSFISGTASTSATIGLRLKKFKVVERDGGVYVAL
jgi:hypothetical protein